MTMSIPIHETEITVTYFVHKKLFLGAGYVRGLSWIEKITSFSLMFDFWKAQKIWFDEDLFNFVFRTSSVEKPVPVLTFWNSPAPVPFPYHAFEN